MTSIKAVGHRLLLKPHFVEDTVEEGALKGFKLDVGDTFKREKAATVVGEVIDIGSTCWYTYDRYLPNGEVNPEWKPWCEVGDIVYFAKFGGKFIKDINDEEFIICNDEDIQGIYQRGQDND